MNASGIIKKTTLIAAMAVASLWAGTWGALAQRTPVENPIAERIPTGDVVIELETVAVGMVSPLGMTVPDDGSGRFFVYDQAGLIHVIQNGAKLAEPLLDARSRLVPLGVFGLSSFDERGLLGAATHPDFATNPKVYTYTSEPLAGTADLTTPIPTNRMYDHQAVIAEWTIDSGNPNKLDPASRREILRVDQPQFNHNAGTIRFGPDGFLYIAFGDGGGADDLDGQDFFGAPLVGHGTGNGQNTDTPHGSLLRIDVDATTSPNGQYGVPGDNPYVGVAGLDEIYAYGFRNPYAFSFDPLTDALYLGDVGQNDLEEVDVVTLGGNYGWNHKEGSFFFDPNGVNAGFVTLTATGSEPPGLIDPIAEYDHDDGLAIVGGFVYRGTAIPELAGRYITGDWGAFNAPSGRLFYLDAGDAMKEFQLGLDDRGLGLWLKGFGQDAQGDVYLFGATQVGPFGTTGVMRKIVAGPDPLRIPGASTLAGEVTVEQEGGVGPIGFQKKNRLADATWMTLAVQDQSPALTPGDGGFGFYRLEDRATLTRIPLSVALSGDAVQPTPIATAGTGEGVLVLEGNTLFISVAYRELSGPATLAHIHGPAASTANAGVLLDLAPFHQGAFGVTGAFSGWTEISDALRTDILSGRTYINVHTAANGSGEIRGQIAPVLMTASLSGLNVRTTPLDVDGLGTGAFMLLGNQLSFNLTYRDLTGVANNAHIHGPATVDQTAGVLVGLAPFNGGGFGVDGTLSGSVTLTAAQRGLIVDGLGYVNIHTPANGSGEIRGQIQAALDAIPLTSVLGGDAERPTPVTTTGNGTASFALRGNVLTFDLAYADLSAVATAAHIHGPATTADGTGVLVNLGSFNGGSWGTSGTLSGSVVLTPDVVAAILDGRTYVNVHTSTHTGGEIRGQIAPVLMGSSLSGDAVRPTRRVTPGVGFGHMLLAHDRLMFTASYRDLTAVANNAHIHGRAPITGNAGVLVPLAPFLVNGFGVAATFSGSTPLTSAQRLPLIDGDTYINVHSPTYGSGEIRGQITR